MAINIDFFTEVEDFKKIIGDILMNLKNSTLSENAEKIYVAGEKEYLNEIYIRKNGVPVNENLMKNIRIMCEDLKIDF